MHNNIPDDLKQLELQKTKILSEDFAPFPIACQCASDLLVLFRQSSQ